MYISEICLIKVQTSKKRFSKAFINISEMCLIKISISKKTGAISYILRVPNFIRLASCSILTVGSDPIERKHMSGVFVSLSDHVSWRSSMTPSAYRRPNDSSTYFRAWDKVRSGAHDLQSRVRNEGLKKSSDISCTLVILYDGKTLQFLLIKTNVDNI